MSSLHFSSVHHYITKQHNTSKQSATISQPKPSQAKVLTGGEDLREAQVDVPLSVSQSCVRPHRWAL